MPIERIDSIYDLQALQIEQEKYLALLKESKAAIIDLNAQRVTAKGADLSNMVTSTKELEKTIATSNKTTEKAIVTSKEYQRLVSQISDKTKDYTESSKNNNKAIIEGRLAKAEYNKELKSEIQLEQAAAGSINQKKLQLSLLQKSYDALSESQRNANDGQALLKSIKDLDKELKTLEGDTGRFQRNVGNYSGAISVLKKSLEELVPKMDKLKAANTSITNSIGNSVSVSSTYTSTLAENENQLVTLQSEYDLLNKLINTQEAGFANATMEIRANQRALLDLENAGLAGTESFRKLEQETGNLQDQMADLKARTKQLGSDTFVFDGLISAAQGLAGAYGAAQGVAALFGEENEDLQKTFVKLQAVMTVIQSLQAIQNALQAESAGMLLLQDLRTKALAISQGVYAVAVGTSTGAMKLFRIALLATGIGAIIGLLYLAADAMGVFGDSAADATEDLEAQAEALKKNKESLDEIAVAAEKNRNRAKGGLNDLKRELELAEAGII